MRLNNRPAVWAPTASRVELITPEGRLDLTPGPREGWWTTDPLPPGIRYGFSLDGGPTLPDPRSLSQPDGPHGLSEVVDLPQPASWEGRDVRGAVLYELHVGTFTPEGTFQAAIDRLDQLVELGVEAVEVMPVADFAGVRGWGYDGVGLYAVHHAYGGPEAFIRFIDACHERGLAVVLDVVHNHVGPEGNYLASFGPYFSTTHLTPWGGAVNLDGPGSREVRDFLLGACRQWIVDFGVDAFRLDAVQAFQDESELHFLAELSGAVTAWAEELDRPLTLIAEHEGNLVSVVSPVDSAQDARGMSAQWADDVHHALHAFLTREEVGYYVDFGTAAELAQALTRVFVRDGRFSRFHDGPFGSAVDPDAPHYDGHSFVVCLQNHDQVGNRATGDRLSHHHDPGLQAAGAALYLLSAYTPMLFMGEEWAASSPFPFFSDLGPELGPLVSEGRAREFARTGGMEGTPDPQAEATFRSAQLNWDERERDVHRRMLEWYRQLIQVRRSHPEVRDPSLRSTTVDVLDADTVVMRRGALHVAATRHVGPVNLPVPTNARVLARWDARGEVADGDTSLHGPGALIWI